MNFWKGDSKDEAKAEDPIVGDSDFGDFDAGAADAADAPEPEPVVPIETLAGVDPTLESAATITPVPYSQWYRLDERYALMDFWAEGVIIAAFVVLMVLYSWGARGNRSRAKGWFRAHAPALAKEFAAVGFNPKVVTSEGPTLVEESEALRERSPFEFSTYATGRSNVAFVDAKIQLIKRFNPINSLVEMGLSTFFESFTMPEDFMEAILYPFDGRESQIVPDVPGTAELRKPEKSAYDGFVFALVNKDRMKKLRDDRYDLSITFTKDHPKLPVWATCMSENAEITDAILTDELIKAVDKAGELFDHLIVSDQPIVKPKTVEECKSTKRIFLKYRLPSSDSEYEKLTPLWEYYLRMSDQIVKAAHFRPQVNLKLKALRDHQVKELQRQDEVEKAEERALDRDRAKKEKRDKELSALDAKQQKKYLEKEKEREMKKMMKRGTMRG